MDQENYMKAVILAGGLGTRLAEETETKPKPMVEIGGKPILWHIMKIYAAHGVRDFVICLGYKGYAIKEFFVNFHHHNSDLTVHTGTGEVSIHRRGEDDWHVTLVETGLGTMTGGRLKRIRDYVADEDAFFMTYGDGVASIDITALLAFHRAQGRLATVTAVRPPGRFGALEIVGNTVKCFLEKPSSEGDHINGGFFVLSPKVLDLVADDATVWEGEPLEALAREGQLAAFIHNGFWQPMDTLREKRLLEELWASGKAEWKQWT
jgi:glucose-1-phosphate cytidylyltransferase